MNWPLLQNSLLVAGITTALAVGFGFVAALWLATLEARWRNIFLVTAIVALALPTFLVTNCWISLLGETGALRAWLPFKIYSLGGTIWILASLLWPLTLFATLAAWRRLEAAQFECEPAMSGFALLRWLLIPAAKGELALAAVLTFVLALNNFAVPAILQTKVLPDELWIQFSTTFFQMPDGSFDFWRMLQLSLPLVIAPVLLLSWAAPRDVRWPRMQGSVSARVFRRQLGSVWRSGCGVVAMLVCALSAGLPLVQILSAKRTWVELAGAMEASTGAIWNSFWFAALAATVVAGIALSFHRTNAETLRGEPGQSRLTAAATTLAWLLFFIPGVLIGIALIKVFNRPPVLVALYQSVGIVLLALVIRYFALAWTAARHAVAGVDKDLTDAARLEGTSRSQMFRFVVWPQIAPQMFAVWYVVYLLCLWDVESIVLVQPPGGETLALKIFNLLHYGYSGQVNALCLVLLGLAVVPLGIWWSWQTASGGARNTEKRTANTKHETPNIKQTPSSNLRLFCGQSFLGVGRLRFLWCLLFGVCCLGTGCSPQAGKPEASISSQFFDRAVVIGSRGVGLGEFNKPRSLACDLQDNVYVVDMTGRVQKFSPEGQFMLSWQMPETSLGKAKGMGRDRAGNLLVVEPHYQRVNHFTPEGTLVAQWGCKGTEAGCFNLPRAVAVNSRGEILVSEYQGEERVQRFELRVHSRNSTVQSQPLIPALSPSDAERTSRIESLNPLTRPGDTLSPAGAEGDSGGARLLQVIGRAGTAPGEFNRPEGICVDAQDRLYVADSCNHRIQFFSSDGKFLRAYGKAGSGRGELSYPYDITVDAEGNQFVCEFGNSRIQVFNVNGEPLEIIGGPGPQPGRFANPWAVALDSQGNLYVADSQNHRVQKLVRRKGQVGRIGPLEAEAATGRSRITQHVSR